MRRLWLVGILAVCACKRTHEAPRYESDNVPVAAEPQVAEAPAADLSGNANPFNEPVLPKPVAQAPKMPDGGTLNGDPGGPRPADFRKVTDAAQPAVLACFTRAELATGTIPLQVHFTVEPRGETGAIRVTGDAPKAVTECVQGVVAGLKYPAYRGPKVDQDLGFTYQKHEQTTTTTPASGATTKP